MGVLVTVTTVPAVEPVFRDGQYIKLPKGDYKGIVIKTPKPPYPVEFRRQRREAAVRLRIYVGVDGRVDAVGIQKIVGDPIVANYAAKMARSDFKFRPPVLNGKPAAVFVDLPIVFVVDAPGGPVTRLGYTYGSQPGGDLNAFIDRYGK